MTDARVHGVAVEVLGEGEPETRVHGEAIEVLGEGVPETQVHGIAVEALGEGVPETQVHALAVEVLQPYDIGIQTVNPRGNPLRAKGPDGAWRLVRRVPVVTTPTITVHQTKGSTTTNLALDSVPTSGQTLLLHAGSIRNGARNVTSVTGYGATWYKLFGDTGNQSSLWCGTATGSSTQIAVTFDGAHNGQFLWGVVCSGQAMNRASGANASATGTSLVGPTVSAGAGKLVLSFSVAIALSSVMTFPTNVDPDTGWTTSLAGGFGGTDSGFAYRLPSATEDHRVDFSTTVSDYVWTQTVVFG